MSKRTNLIPWVALCVLEASVLYGVIQASQTTFVPAGSVWKYLDNGSDQGTAWRSDSFNDDGWASGPAKLGYGGDGEITVLSYGPNPDNKYRTTYFRHSFTVADTSGFKSIILKVLRDDGAIIYLNGAEVWRTNMDDGEINYLSFAASTVGGSAEHTFFEKRMDSGSLVNGTNVLAVEIHQRSAGSSDIGFDLELVGSTEDFIPEMRKGPYLIYPGDNTQMTILWQLDDTKSCTLEWGLDNSYSVGSILSDEYNSDHQHRYTVTDLISGARYYYRVGVGPDYYTGSFLTAPATDATAVKFMAYGDTRSNPDKHDDVCAAIVSTFTFDPDFQTYLLHSGDWVGNGDNESDWTTHYFGRTRLNTIQLQANVPIQGCMGNHERSGNLYKKYWPYPFVNNRYWSFDYGPVHVSVVDQYVDYSPGSAQLAWLENDLSTSTKDWKFILLHEPGWSAGKHSNVIPVQIYLQPLCLAYGVDIIFAGHNHYYARCEVDGVQHITTGGGGAPLYEPNLEYPYIVTALETLQFCKIDIQGNELNFQAVKPDGTIIDEFAIVAPLKVPMLFTPRVLNKVSKGKWIKAHFILPEGFAVEDVDINTPATIDPIGIESDYIDVFINKDGLVEIEIAFNRSNFCEAGINYGPAEVNVTGSFSSGEHYYGTDTIRIITNNLEDIAVLASHWLETMCHAPTWCGGQDINHDSMVNFADFAPFTGCCIEVVEN